MKKFLHSNKQEIIFILLLVFIWRLFLLLPDFFAMHFLPQRQGYIGATTWANFDGVHYLSIAQSGYFQYEQAFFPLFPLLIKMLSFLTFGNYVWAGMILVYVSLFLWLFVFYKLLQMDYKVLIIRWALIFSMFFPTAFFFGALYTESLFLLLVIMAFYTARKKQWVLAGLFVGLASATKLIGIFLLPAILLEFYLAYKQQFFSKKHLVSLCMMVFLSISGIVIYMGYLWKVYADPLFFIHAQPAFGANRSGGEIILLPQVLFRYIKIFLTVPFSQYDFWIALLECNVFFLSFFILLLGFWKKKIRLSYILFSFLAIVGPTATGSLSSIPRYVLVAFPVFIFLGMISSRKTKVLLLILSSLLLFVLTSYFLQGYFIA